MENMLELINSNGLFSHQIHKLILKTNWNAGKYGTTLHEFDTDEAPKTIIIKINKSQTHKQRRKHSSLVHWTYPFVVFIWQLQLNNIQSYPSVQPNQVLLLTYRMCIKVFVNKHQRDEHQFLVHSLPERNWQFFGFKSKQIIALRFFYVYTNKLLPQIWIQHCYGNVKPSKNGQWRLQRKINRFSFIIVCTLHAQIPLSDHSFSSIPF